ncbi:DUF5994 family protein [Streptomyces sp. NBC_01361]|uniref:DUF5994 family protein n=1 Tax=Streptomyces sp. NBC_01361 TaxID=2903838 RepID=UPI003FCE5CE0
MKPGTALLRLQTTHSREGILDGAWWPRSRDHGRAAPPGDITPGNCRVVDEYVE